MMFLNPFVHQQHVRRFPDRRVSPGNIIALVLNIAKDPASIMNDDANNYEFRITRNQGKWCHKENCSQEAMFVIVGEINPCDLDWDHLDVTF